MIYLDNAATTYPKPASVQNAVSRALVHLGANPGRAGHTMSMACSEEIYRCREAAAELFHAPGPECVAFTLNCTHAINYVVKGILRPGDHVVTSCLEHNAVARPLYALARNGVSVTEARVYPGDDDATVRSFAEAIQENTILIVCTHASNVWGIRLPVERIAALAHQRGIRMAVDTAQSAGVLPIDMGAGIDYLCAAGHKGLYGPMGTGMLLSADGSELSTLIEGGTGTNSAMPEQPSTMPDRMESGTQNMPGIAGLHAGIEFVRSKGTDVIYRHEMSVTRALYEKLASVRGVHLYTPEPSAPYYAPVLSFNVGDVPSEEIGRKLNEKGVAVRAGLHCAPAAHQFMGTLEQGAVRICPSVFTGNDDVSGFISSLRAIV
jgi:cysteine desulfurase family protein